MVLITSDLGRGGGSIRDHSMVPASAETILAFIRTYGSVAPIKNQNDFRSDWCRLKVWKRAFWKL